MKAIPENTSMWTQEEAVSYECAREVITDMIAIRTAEIAAEGRQTAPNQARLTALEKQITALWRERDRLDPTDAKSIERIETVYGGEVRAYFQSSDSPNSQLQLKVPNAPI
jgi:hypothetical protein